VNAHGRLGAGPLCNHDCSTATVAFLKNYGQLQIGLGFLVIVVPGLIDISGGD
jgi:hypothetical protein